MGRSGGSSALHLIGLWLNFFDERESHQPPGLAGATVHLTLAAPGGSAATTVSLFDQGITRVIQAAVLGLEPGKPYVLALASKPDGSGPLQLSAQFTANPAGAQIVNAVGPIRQIVDPEAVVLGERHYLAVARVEAGRPGSVVQLHQSEVRRSAAR